MVKRMEKVLSTFLPESQEASVLHESCFKLVFRHSLRPSLHDADDPDNVLLSEEGLVLARCIGKQIDKMIGEVHSSHVGRCVQTAQCLIDGRSFLGECIVISPDVLGDVFSVDRDLANQSIRECSLKGIIKKMIDKEPVPGMRLLEDCVKDLLHYLFSTGNTPGYLDLYCTHDFHLAMLYAALFRESDTLDEILNNWPEMMEGMLFLGRRNDFYCSWRGRTKHIMNVLP